MLTPELWVSLGLILAGAIIAASAWLKSKNDQFYSDVFWGWPLGVYVWGDGLILGPFWIVIGLLSLIMWGSSWLMQTWLIFMAVRSSYEVIYWINHQVAKREYMPPIVRRLSFLKANEAAIIYQLFHTCVVVLCFVILAS
jgi:hypothetical protein